MAKTYKKISGAWYGIKKIFIKITSGWVEVKKVFKNVGGGWVMTHQNAIDFTFGGSITASAFTGIPLSAYINPASADTFNITLNGGVLFSGVYGGDGGAGANVWCLNSSGQCTNGGNGGAGGYGIDFTGFAGKTINLYNYGTIKGGNGGNGGPGGNGVAQTSCGFCSVYGCPGGNGGPGGAPYYNNGGVAINIIVNAGGIINGYNGAAGPSGTTGIDDGNCE